MRERADAYLPHTSASTFAASSRPGAASRLRRGAVVGHNWRDLSESCGQGRPLSEQRIDAVHSQVRRPSNISHPTSFPAAADVQRHSGPARAWRPRRASGWQIPLLS